MTVCALLCCSVPGVYADLGPAQTGLSAGAETAATSYFNPAGMTRLERSEIVVDALVFYAESRFDIKPGSTEGAGTSIEDDGFGAIPSFYYVKPINERWRFGISVSAPLGFGSDWGEGWPGRYIVEESTWFYVGVTPVVAYRINDKWSVGGGVAINYSVAESQSAINNVLDGLPDGRIKLETSGLGLGFNLSALYEFSSRTRLGLVYRSESDPELEGVPEFENLGPVKGAALLAAGVLGKRVTVEWKIPQIVQTGILHELDNKVKLMADLWWIDFSEFGFSTVTVGDNSISSSAGVYDDMWAFSTGVEWPWKPSWSTAVGLLYVSEGVSDENRSLSMPLDRIIGVGAGVAKKVDEDAGWRLNINYYDLGEAPIDSEPSSVSGRIVGSYSKKHALGLNFNYQWKY